MARHLIQKQREIEEAHKNAMMDRTVSHEDVACYRGVVYGSRMMLELFMDIYNAVGEKNGQLDS